MCSSHALLQSVCEIFGRRLIPTRRFSIIFFGTKTGRLTTKKSSFPILTLDSTFRSVIKPQNDWLVELDFNAAELRTLLSLAGKEQPKEDIHDWNMKTVLKRAKSREDAKKKSSLGFIIQKVLMRHLMQSMIVML